MSFDYESGGTILLLDNFLIHLVRYFASSIWFEIDKLIQNQSLHTREYNYKTK